MLSVVSARHVTVTSASICPLLSFLAAFSSVSPGAHKKATNLIRADRILLLTGGSKVPISHRQERDAGWS